MQGWWLLASEGLVARLVDASFWRPAGSQVVGSRAGRCWLLLEVTGGQVAGQVDAGFWRKLEAR